MLLEKLCCLLLTNCSMFWDYSQKENKVNDTYFSQLLNGGFGINLCGCVYFSIELFQNAKIMNFV